MRSPASRQEQLACIPLLLKRKQDEVLVPDNDTPLHDADCVLFCGEAHAHRLQALGVHDYNMLNYLLTGNEAPGGLVWRSLARRGKS
jgi:hypothetical protein